MMPRRCAAPAAQSGFLLIEVLVAILIFAVGVLALVGLQTTALQDSGAAKHRADATLLANDLLARMRTGDRSVAALQAAFNSPDGPGYTAWLPSVEAVLPGVAAHPPQVAIEPDCAPVSPCGSAIPSSRVTVDVYWKPPTASAAEAAHHVTVVTRIK